MVTELLKDDDENITGCNLEAVMTKNNYSMAWQDLEDKQDWLMGWK